MADSQETPQIDNSEERGGNAKSMPEGKRFTSEYQPDPQNKSIGLKKRFALRDLLRMSTGAIKTKSGEDLREKIALAFGVEIEDVTHEMLMDFKQIEIAVKKGDTAAYKAVKEFTYGKPKQQQDEPPPPVIGNTDEEQKSKFDLGGGIVFDV